MFPIGLRLARGKGKKGATKPSVGGEGRQILNQVRNPDEKRRVPGESRWVNWLCNAGREGKG